MCIVATSQLLADQGIGYARGKLGETLFQGEIDRFSGKIQRFNANFSTRHWEEISQRESI
jgi:hypothetical protein